MFSRDAALLLAYACFSFCTQLPDTNLLLHVSQSPVFSADFMQVITGVAGVPWILKPFVGAFCDATPVFGLVRAPYIMLGSLGFAVCWMCLPSAAGSRVLFGAVLLLQSFFAMLSDVMLDGLLVARVKATEAAGSTRVGSLQSTVWIVRAAASLCAAIVGGVVAQAPFQAVCVATGLLFMLLFVLAQKLEPCGQLAPPPPAEGACGVLRRTGDVLLLQPTRSIVSFLFLLCACPTASVVLSFFMAQDLQYAGREFTIIDVSGHLASLLGGVAFKYLLRQVSFRRIFATCIVFIAVLRAVQLLLAFKVTTSCLVAAADEAAMSIVNTVLVMPVLLVAAQASDANSSAVYASVLSIANLGSIVGTELGALASAVSGVERGHYGQLPYLLIVLTLVGLLPLGALFLVPRTLSALTLGCGDRAPEQQLCRLPTRSCAFPPRAGAAEAPERPRPSPPAGPALQRSRSAPALLPAQEQSCGGRTGTCRSAQATCGHTCTSPADRSTACDATSCEAVPLRRPSGIWGTRPRIWRRVRAAFRAWRCTGASSSLTGAAVQPLATPASCAAV